MAKEFLVQDPTVDYPTVNVALCTSFLIRGEIQLHQGARLGSQDPMLDAVALERDVVSMSREQAILVARKILELFGE